MAKYTISVDIETDIKVWDIYAKFDYNSTMNSWDDKFLNYEMKEVKEVRVTINPNIKAFIFDWVWVVDSSLLEKYDDRDNSFPQYVKEEFITQEYNKRKAWLDLWKKNRIEELESELNKLKYGNEKTNPTYG